MPANIDPIFTRLPDVSNNATTGMNQLVLLASNDYTGAGSNNSLIFTADAVNGSFVQRIRFKAGGTNVASVARIFINNGSSNLIATNNVFLGETSLPATTAIATAAMATAAKCTSRPNRSSTRCPVSSNLTPAGVERARGAGACACGARGS